MHELDDVWIQMLAEAAANAKASGRHDVADYLALKAMNDEIRNRGTRWLFDSFIEMAGEANRRNSAITIERDDPHSFAHRGANMVGSRLSVRQGVRCLTIEAGWTRTPGDGFMRGGALAVAKITHFGIKSANEELSLIHTGQLPEWYSTQKDESQSIFGAENLRRHFDILIGY